MISKENWLAEVSPAVRDAVTQRSRLLKIPAGATFRQAGDPGISMYQIESGYLKLHSLLPDGGRVLLLLYAPGNCFGESPLVARRTHNHTTVALTDARVRALQAGDFWDIYNEFPEVPEALCRKFANALGRSLASRESRAASRLRAMVGATFAVLAEESGVRAVDGTIGIPLPLTQGDFAEYLEVTRQAAQREIGALKQAGIIAQEKGGWRILRPDLLEG